MGYRAALSISLTAVGNSPRKGGEGMRIPIILTVLLMSSVAQASEWVSIGKSDKGTEGLVDVSSIVVDGNIRRAWFKIAWIRRNSYTLERDAFDCAQQVMRAEAYTMHSGSGTDFRQSVDSFPDQWKPIPPDTMGSELMQFVCTWKPK
jgi:hypothetical protein